MIVRNEEVKEVLVEIPEGHRHIRTTVVLSDGQELTFQEATMANLVRAYISVKTHPELTQVRMKGRNIGHRKEGYAEWQLLEDR